MSAQFTNHISVLEALWTLIGLIGSVFAVVNLREALRELSTLRGSGVESRRRRILHIVAVSGVRNATIRLVKLGVIITIGVLAMLTANPPDTVPWTPLRYTITFGLLILPCLITSQSVLDRRDLRRIQNELSSLDGESPGRRGGDIAPDRGSP